MSIKYLGTGGPFVARVLPGSENWRNLRVMGLDSRSSGESLIMSCFGHLAGKTLIYLAAGLMLLLPLSGTCCCGSGGHGCSRAENRQLPVPGKGGYGRRALACCATAQATAQSCCQQVQGTPGQDRCRSDTCFCSHHTTPPVVTPVRPNPCWQADDQAAEVSPAVSLPVEQAAVSRRFFADDWVSTCLSAAGRCAILCRFLC